MNYINTYNYLHLLVNSEKNKSPGIFSYKVGEEEKLKKNLKIQPTTVRSSFSKKEEVKPLKK